MRYFTTVIFCVFILGCGKINTSPEFFKPDDNEMKNKLIQTTDKKEQKKALKYYKKLIDKVLKNKAVDIPGFKDLHELSGSPILNGIF